MNARRSLGDHEVFEEVRRELSATQEMHEPMRSAHEGYAILLEKVDKLWNEVKKNPSKHPRQRRAMHQEAVQVAAMAMRFIIDITGKKGKVG